MTRIIERPEVFLVGLPSLDWREIRRYLDKVGVRTDSNATSWSDRAQSDISLSEGDALVEFGGRLCYRSWVPGANINVTRIREDSKQYLGNILKSGHGSVTEHANYSFVFDDRTMSRLRILPRYCLESSRILVTLILAPGTQDR